jgi:AraC family transcriptional regulator of adaptative response/methylated-DNA-[protein]-cysteine methyltransferase
MMMNDFYEALVRRDAAYEGRFIYAVKTTGVYCRPVCKSRRPLRENVEFFNGAEEARAAGYRACKRCKPDRATTADERILRACRFIEEAEAAPPLRELSAFAGMSETYFQRRFTAEIGLSPRRYGQMVRERRLRSSLREGGSVTNAIYEAGFNSASQVYGNVHAILGMTPADSRNGGKDVEITYSIVDSALGGVLIAATSRGICRVDIATTPAELEDGLRSTFPRAKLERADDRLESSASLIVAYLCGENAWPRLPVDVRASAFQARVWNALRDILPGTTLSYAQLAEAIGSPSAARAVARACATNPIALLIPCHRIVPSAGGVGGYRWGPERKRKLIDIERARAARA